MKLPRLFFLSLIALICSGSTTAQSQQNSGQGFKVDTKRLPKAEHHTSPLEIQIIDGGPIVKDLRRPPEGPNNLIINVAPLQSQPGTTTVFNAGSPGGAGQASQGQPGGVVIDLNRPPRSGFQSNAQSIQNNKPSGLPNGTTTNRLGNSAQANLQGQVKTPTRKPTVPIPGKQATQKAAMYPSSTGAQGAASSNQVQSSVATSARILHNRQKKP